ncbi:MAG: MerR family transcriptional regulator [Ghiorsea sp.]
MQEMGTFPIRHIAEVTGVLTVTLRAWERRYGLLKPQRTDKGHRLYSEADINRVQQVLGLLAQGVAISQVRQVLDKKDESPTEKQPPEGLDVLQSQLQDAALGFDSLAVSQVIYEAGATYPLNLLAERLIRPVRHRLQQGSDAVHLAATSALLSGLSLAMLRRKSHLGQKKMVGSFLFVGFEGEVGCISYEVGQAAAAEVGLQVYAVGHQLPLLSLAEVAKHRAATAIVLWVDLEPKQGWEQDLATLRTATKLPIWMGGEFASRHHQTLQHMAVQVLPLEAGKGMLLLKGVLA